LLKNSSDYLSWSAENSSEPLYQVAEETGCTGKGLIQLAIDGQFDICAELPWNFEALRVNADGHIVDINQKQVTGPRRVKIPAQALSEYLANKQACISFFKSYDEPDIFYQSSDEWRIAEIRLVVMRKDLERIFDYFIAQRAIIAPDIEVPKRADLIDLVTLSKVMARRYNMTNAEACYWVTEWIEPEHALYDMSGFALPKRLHELKTRDAPSACFNQYWWEHPKLESEPIRSLDGISANGIAISKADAEKFCLIPSSEMNELATEKLPLSADALGVIIRANLIDLISLSKAIARHANMTSIEACERVTGDIIRNRLSVYSLTSIAVPKLIESSEGMIISTSCYELWSEYPDIDDFELERFCIKASQVAISKTDAEKFCLIPSSEMNELATEKLPLSADALGVIIRANVIDLISLSKAIARHHKMTFEEVLKWCLDNIFSNNISVYDLSEIGFPRKMTVNEGRDAACNSFNENWWINPANEHIRMVGYEQMCADEVAISKADAEKYFSIPTGTLEESVPEKQPLYPVNTAGIDEMSQIINGVQEAEELSFLTKELITLNKAAYKFWLNADPNDKGTHPTNEQVSDWLKSQGFSDISAKQGAVIIRPEWAARGRR
jgi:hypothetical protein